MFSITATKAGTALRDAAVKDAFLWTEGMVYSNLYLYPLKSPPSSSCVLWGQGSGKSAKKISKNGGKLKTELEGEKITDLHTSKTVVWSNFLS